MRPWPELEEEDRWLTDVVAQQITHSDMSPDELRNRARELRQQATDTDIDGMQHASLALAERYEAAAKARLSTR